MTAQPKLTISNVQEILRNISYKDWEIVFKWTPFSEEHDWWIQVRFMDTDITAPELGPQWQYCRKWKLSQFMSETEVVRTAWKAILAAEEHETAEKFTYRGYRIYDPHFDVNVFIEAAKNHSVVTRIPPQPNLPTLKEG